MEKKKVTKKVTHGTIAKKSVMIFGVFDRLHAGHQFFIAEAKKKGSPLYIALAPDQVVTDLKNKVPHEKYAVRKKNLRKFFPNAIIVRGDRRPGSWDVVKKNRPEIIACGYDQRALYQTLVENKSQFPFLKKMTTIRDHFGEKFHTSLLPRK